MKNPFLTSPKIGTFLYLQNAKFTVNIVSCTHTIHEELTKSNIHTLLRLKVRVMAELWGTAFSFMYFLFSLYLLGFNYEGGLKPP